MLVLGLAGCTGANVAEDPTLSTTTTATGEHHLPEDTAGPTARTEVEVSGEIEYPDGLTIPEDEAWVFDPDVDTTLTVSENIVVLGKLVMRPSSSDVEHVIVFSGVDETEFVGGGMDPVDSDVGLWVMGTGELDLQGEEKQAWSHEFEGDWVGDEVIAVPNAPGDFSGFTAVDSTPPPNGLGYPPELLNLTRNVRVEGTPEGRAHVFIRSSRPQSIRFAAFRYMAPDPAGFSESAVTGRYGIHFHHSGDGSRGSVVEGVVVREAGNHAFVPHGSHGITFRDTIAFDVANDAYWWDEPPAPEDSSNDSNDIVWDRAVAALVRGVAGGDTHRLSAFFLGRGLNPTITNSIAVGVQNEGGADRSGFHWPEKAEATWTFQDNIAHNNAAHGIFVWQNNEMPHVIDGFTAYFNELAGVEHGAYLNSYEYREMTLLDNGVSIVSHALGKPDESGSVDTQVWEGLVTDGGVLYVDLHTLEAAAPVRFVDCDLAGIYVADREGQPSAYDFVDCGIAPDDFELTEANPDSLFRIQRADGSAIELKGDGSVREIPGFSS